MSDRRRGLGRGLGALLPQGPIGSPLAEHAASPAAPSPVDVFFRERQSHTRSQPDGVETAAPAVGRVPTDPLEHAQAPLSRDAAAPDAAARDAQVPDDGATNDETAPRPDVPELIGGAYYAEVPVERIAPNPRQPRKAFDEEALAELVASIQQVGLLQPVVVRPRGDGYELVVGERRWRAAQTAGLERIPALVRTTGDQDMLRDALLENLHRSELNALEEAAAYGQLLEDFGCTHEELARRIGRSRPHISNTLRLLKLPPLVQRRVAAGVLSAGHARALLSVDDPAGQERLAQRIVAEGLSVRSVEEIAALGEAGSHGSEVDLAPRAPRRVRASVPGLDELADRLADRFETRVKVDLGKSRGKIVVEFASLEDLERIVALMTPDLGSTGRAPGSSAGDGGRHVVEQQEQAVARQHREGDDREAVEFGRVEGHREDRAERSGAA